MTTRDIFILALRVLGIWTFLRALGGVAGALAATFMFFKEHNQPGGGMAGFNLAGYVFVTWMVPVALGFAACVLWLYAPKLASPFYGDPKPADEVPPVISVTEGGMYRVACRVLGIYALLVAVPSLTTVIASFTSQQSWDEYHHAVLLTTCFYFVFSLVLICGAGRIAAWLGRIRYNPERADPDKYHTPGSDAE